MTDSQLTAILTCIVDILASIDVRAEEVTAIAKARELVAAAETTKPVPFGGSGTVSV